MDDAGIGAPGEPLETSYISGGSQNEIYGILREWRIIAALEGTDVPHTPAIAMCEDKSVLGRSFYLMGFVEGWSPMGLENRAWPAPFDTDLDARKGLAYQL